MNVTSLNLSSPRLWELNSCEWKYKHALYRLVKKGASKLSQALLPIITAIGKPHSNWSAYKRNVCRSPHSCRLPQVAKWINGDGNRWKQLYIDRSLSGHKRMQVTVSMETSRMLSDGHWCYPPSSIHPPHPPTSIITLRTDGRTYVLMPCISHLSTGIRGLNPLY